MTEPRDPKEVYESAEAEGRRRLDMPPMEQVATGFIAGVTVVFGIVALAVVYGLVEPRFGPEIADLAGGAAFGIGLVFLVVGRSELFSENFFDPVAATLSDTSSRHRWARLARLWSVTLVLNLVGGLVLVGVLSVDQALPDGATGALATVAAEMADKPLEATAARAVLAGALLTLLSYLLHAADSTGARMAAAYLVGFFVAVGPFDHVVVNALHLVFGMRFGDVAAGDVVAGCTLAAAGNVVGGVLLMTLTHTAQARASRG